MTPTFEELAPLVKNYQFKPYLYLQNFGVGKQRINHLFEEEIKERLMKDPLIETVTAQGQCKAVVLFRELAFDSEILRKRVGKIDLILADSEELVQELVKKLVKSFHKFKLDYATYRLSSQDLGTIAVLKKNGFEIVDEYNTLISKPPLDFHFEQDPAIFIREATEEDILPLQQAVAPTFIYSRFFTDPLVSHQSAVKMHEEWIANSIKRQIADQVLVTMVNSQPVGFITLEMDKASRVLDKKIGHIPLIGVDPEFRGRHIGSILAKAAFGGWFKDMGAELVRVETQANNLPANKTYQNAGFTLVEKSVTLRWNS